MVDCDSMDNKAIWDWMMLMGDIWTTHGAAVAAATPFLPSFFDRPPGYKAKELQTYFYTLGPAFFYGILPEKYWMHQCKIASAMCHIHQHCIFIEHLCAAHLLFLTYVLEFEHLFYQRKTSCIHFCQQSVHLLWTMEWLIGDLGREIRQPSNPYQNLAQRGVLCVQINALKAMIPDIEPDNEVKIPNNARPFNSGYVLLQWLDARLQDFTGCTEGISLQQYFVARSWFKEQDMKRNALSHVRQAHNVKMLLNNEIHFGEVHFYFIHRQPDNTDHPYALVSIYGPPCPDL
ncbi:hypothetical protein FISHEDRAFT_68115 [Fistulina hepatica ATCC 64428]|nr:hypothetical protein FISHEDRAFT_68115 [Fistulina hepatica ATCC 64428]